MCGGCLQNIEALIVCGAGAAVAATNAWEAHTDRLAGVTPTERAQRTWLRNKAFMEELGLDPVQVLGLPPRQPLPRTPAAGAAAAELTVSTTDG